METDPPPRGGAASTDVAAMAGETEHRVLVGRLPADEPPVHGVKVEFADWHLGDNAVATAPLPTLRWRQHGYVHCEPYGYHQPRGRGWYPDPLLAPGPHGVTLHPGVTTSLWISVQVPTKAQPGNYSTIVTVLSSRGKLVTLPLKLLVWPIVLPTIDAGRYSSIISYNHVPLVANQTAVFQFMCEHRVPPTSLYIAGPRPHSDYDFIGGPQCDGGAHWLNLGELDVVGGNRQMSYSPSEVARRLAILEPTVDYLQTHDLMHRAFVYGFDEMPPSYEPAIRQLFGGVKAKWPTLRTMAVLNWPKMPNDLPLDVWVRAMQPQYHKAAADDWNQPSVATWKAAHPAHEYWEYWCCCYNYSSCLNSFVEWPGLQSRQMGWLGIARNATGLLYYAANRWLSRSGNGHTHLAPMRRINYTARTDFDPNCAGNSNGEGNYFYPSTAADGRPISSSRFESLRDGLEDVELLSMLREHDIPFNDLLSQVVQSPAIKTSDPETVEAARREAARRLIDARFSRATVSSESQRFWSGWSGPAAKLRKAGKHVELLLDGEPTSLVWWKNHAVAGSGSETFWSTAKYQLELAAAAGIPVVSFVLATSGAGSEGGTDWQFPSGQLDQSVKMMVSAIDAAYNSSKHGGKPAMLWPTVYPHFDDAEPVLTIDVNGNKSHKEYGNSPSAAWANRTSDGLVSLLRLLDKSYPGRVVGLHLAGLQTTEWFFEGNWGTEKSFEADYSNSAVAAWCAAIDRPRGCSAPSTADRTKARTGNTLVVSSAGTSGSSMGSDAARFNRFLSQRTMTTLTTLAQSIKKATHGAALVGVYYGYLYGLAGRRLTGSGHLALSQLLEHPAVDAIVSPYDYATAVRSPTGPLLGHCPMDTARLRGKLYFLEDDSRTVLSIKSNPHPEIHTTTTLQDTLRVLKRNLVTSAMHNVATYLYDLDSKGWWGLPGQQQESEAIWSTVRGATQELSARIWPQSSTFGSTSDEIEVEIALIVDDFSPAYFETAGGPIPRTNPDLGFSSLLNYHPAHALARIGAPFRNYLLTDLLLPEFQSDVLPSLKLIIFANCVHVPRTVSNYINRTLWHSDRTLLWLWAPNVIAEEPGENVQGGGAVHFDPSGPARITGLPLRMGAGESSLQADIAGFAFPYFGPSSYKIAPWFYVDTAAADASNLQLEVLAQYHESKLPALVRGSLPSGATSIFSGAVMVPTEVYAKIAKSSGCKIILDTASDVVEVGGAGLMLVAGDPSLPRARRTVHLPSAVSKVEDLSNVLTANATAPTVCHNCSSFRTALVAPGDVLIYALR